MRTDFFRAVPGPESMTMWASFCNVEVVCLWYEPAFNVSLPCIVEWQAAAACVNSSFCILLFPVPELDSNLKQQQQQQQQQQLLPAIAKT